MVDLSKPCGFPLTFDPSHLTIETQTPFRFGRSSRTIGDLSQVLYSPEAGPPDQTVFYLEHLENAPEPELATLRSQELAYGFTILPPMRIGGEYVKTHGHSHPAVAGHPFSFPEIYAQVYGTMWLFLQKHAPQDLSGIEVCYLIKLNPGDTAIIPPNHAHMQINPSPDEPSFTAGLYCSLLKPEFDFYRKQRGFAYYLVDHAGSPEVIANPRYAKVPALEVIEQVRASAFETIDPGQPVWSALMDSPQRYGFLTRPAETIRQFFDSPG
jgi:glucose-6-phosphate isomerase, archaeal